MSRHNRKNLFRGIKQPLVDRKFRPRVMRHNEPAKRRVFEYKTVMVDKPVADSKRVVIQLPDGTIAIKYEVRVAVSKWAPQTEERTMRVAAGPTAKYGQQNTGGPDAGKKASKPDKP
jgi:hypothetical protein